MLLSVSMRVELVDSYEAMFWKGINLRQRYISTYDSLTRSTIQSVLELVKFRDELLPAGSRKEIADHWQMKVADLGSALVDKMDFAFVDTALKGHDRMLCYPAVFKAIMEMDMAFGKASCLNYLRVLELICMKGKEAEQLWMIQSIRDYIFVLKEYTNKDLSTRALQGSPNNRGLLDVFLAKRKMVLWLLEHLQSKNCPCDWIDTLRSLITHAAFREKVGSGSGSRNADQPDKSWLGTEHEVVRLAVDIMKARSRIQSKPLGLLPFWRISFLVFFDYYNHWLIVSFFHRAPCQKAIFSAQHDHTLKNILKGSSAPPDIFAKEPYNEMLKGVDDALDAVNHKLKRKDEEVQEAKIRDDDLAAFLPEGVEQCPEDLEQAFQAEIQEAAELVDRFVKWIPECESKAELTQALADTAVAKKQPEGTTALIVLDTKTCGESSSQPHLRLPQFRAPGLRNAVQSFCTARNKEQFDEDEMCAVLDGSRMISTSIMACFVRDDGCHFEGKTRTEFVIHYDEKSMRARKMVSRGLVQVHEGLHVFSNGALSLPEARTRLYGGSNYSTSIGPVIMDSFENLWLVSPEKKKEYEAGKAKVLAGGGLAGDPPKKPELSGEPMSFHTMPLKFYKELIHSFCAGVVFFLSDTDGVGALAAILAKVPCVALVYSASHGAALRLKLMEHVFKEFQTQSSPLHRVALTLESNKGFPSQEFNVLSRCCASASVLSN